MEKFPCQNQDSCPERVCREDIHHRFFPKRNYKSEVERAFRELPENKEITCRDRHNDLHATEPVPEKPSRDYMMQALGWSAVEGIA